MQAAAACILWASCCPSSMRVVVATQLRQSRRSCAGVCGAFVLGPTMRPCILSEMHACVPSRIVLALLALRGVRVVCNLWRAYGCTSLWRIQAPLAQAPATTQIHVWLTRNTTPPPITALDLPRSGASRGLLSDWLNSGSSAHQRATLFRGLKVRMGIATGELRRGTDIKNSAVFEMAKCESLDCRAWGARRGWGAGGGWEVGHGGHETATSERAGAACERRRALESEPGWHSPFLCS